MVKDNRRLYEKRTSYTFHFGIHLARRKNSVAVISVGHRD
jgi:hypothetical protein